MNVRFPPESQQIAFSNTDTREYLEKGLVHSAEAEKFHGALAAAGQQVRAGMEASGHARQFERLLGELRCELWIGGRRPRSRASEDANGTQRATDDATISEAKAA